MGISPAATDLRALTAFATLSSVLYMISFVALTFTAGLPASVAYYVQAEVKAFDGQRCAVWWGGYLPGNLSVDAGVDAGTDAGVEDAGVADGGGTVTAPRGCGCSTSGGPLLGLAALLAMAAGRCGRRPRWARSSQRRR